MMNEKDIFDVCSSGYRVMTSLSLCRNGQHYWVCVYIGWVMGSVWEYF